MPNKENQDKSIEIQRFSNEQVSTLNSNVPCNNIIQKIHHSARHTVSTPKANPAKDTQIKK